MKKGLKFTKEQLERLYWKEGLSLSQIGRKFGCNGTNILYWMKKFGIKRRPAIHNYLPIPKEVLEELYINKRLSSLQIADKLGVKHSKTIRKKLKKFGIKTRSLSEALVKKFRRSFSRDFMEKSYLLGLRAGDFYAKKKDCSVRVQTTTTHLAQLGLLKNSFSRYGKICKYLSKHKSREDEWFIYVDLNDSFNFLINKPNEISNWILESPEYFYNFLCAYSDCEGTFNVIKSHKNSVRFIFKIKAGDKKILEQIKEKLESINYNPRLYLDTPKGTKGSFGHSKVDIYNLTLYRKEEVLRLIEQLLPLSKHTEKIRKMNYILRNRNNNNWGEVIAGWGKIKEEIKKELLKNQLNK